MAGIVIIFDFDKTIIECDSDDWVVDELGVSDVFNELRPTMPWNSLMDTMMKELHDRGKTVEDIVEVLKRVPIHSRVVPAIRAAHELGCELRVLSDANVFFIETILEHLGIRECFSEINTNPGFVDEHGRLKILPFHDFTTSSHGCTGICPPNMCKGIILKRIQASLANQRIIYVGDGTGDYCPSLKLNEVDFMMPRKNIPAWELISKNPMLIKAKIHGWTDGEELEKILLSIVETISVEKSSAFASTTMEYRLPTFPVPALPKAPPLLQ